MTGYASNYSMSNNAKTAYSNRLLPAGKMVARIKKRYPRSFKGLTIAVLRRFVRPAERHHTSCKYNWTDFYSIADVFSNRRDIRLEIKYQQKWKKGV